MGSRWVFWCVLSASAALAGVGCKDLRFPSAPAPPVGVTDLPADSLVTVLFVLQDSVAAPIFEVSVEVESMAYDDPDFEEDYDETFYSGVFSKVEVTAPLGRLVDVRLRRGCCGRGDRTRVMRGLEFGSLPETLTVDLDAYNVEIHFVFPSAFHPLDLDASSVDLWWSDSGIDGEAPRQFSGTFSLAEQGYVRAMLPPESIRYSAYVYPEEDPAEYPRLQATLAGALTLEAGVPRVDLADPGWTSIPYTLEFVRPGLPYLRSTLTARASLGGSSVSFDAYGSERHESILILPADLSEVYVSSEYLANVLSIERNVDAAVDDRVELRMAEAEVTLAVTDSLGRPILADVTVDQLGGQSMYRSVRSDGTIAFYVPFGAYEFKVIRSGFAEWVTRVPIEGDAHLDVRLEASP